MTPRSRRARHAGKRQRRRRQPTRRYSRQNCLQCQRHFLTPAFFKAVRAGDESFDGPRWGLFNLVLVFLLVFLSPLRDPVDRFEEAWELYVQLYPGRKRPGRTLQGFYQALSRLPWQMARRLADKLRPVLAATLADGWSSDGWVPFGIDGSTLNLPRTAQLQRFFADQPDGAPHLWLTCLVHVGTGVPWSWCFGAGTSSERDHLRKLLSTLPINSLLLADAGFVGYDTWQHLQKHGKDGQPFLMRVGSCCDFYVDKPLSASFRDGVVQTWLCKRPDCVPRELRLLRLPGIKRRGKGKPGADVWLVTNVFDKKRLSHASARRLYRQRWENELFFRSYKCTLGKTKLTSRTVRGVRREAELSLFSTQLLLAQTAWALLNGGRGGKGSLKEGWRVWQREWKAYRKRGQFQAGYLERLSEAARVDESQRRSSKANRGWPGKKHKPPGKPNLITITAEHKARMEKNLEKEKQRANFAA